MARGSASFPLATDLRRLVRVLVDDVRVLVGEVAAVERVYDEGLVAEVHDPGDAVARLQRRHGAGDELVAAEVVHGAVVVAVLHVLEEGKQAFAINFRAEDVTLESNLVTSYFAQVTAVSQSKSKK